MKAIHKGIALLVIMLVFLTLRAQVSVIATAGTLSGSYATLNAAFTAINAGTHQGVINISVTGNTTEPTPPIPLLRSGTGLSVYTSIHISPSGGNWTVSSIWADMGTGTEYRGLIEILGAQHVTIDGDDPGTPGSQNLTFITNRTSTKYVYVICLGSTDYSGIGGASYDTVRNCIITGPRNGDTALTQSAGILIAGDSAQPPGRIPQGVARGSNYNAFINNTITRSYYGFWMVADNAYTLAELNQGNLIMNDTIGSLNSSKTVLYGVFSNDFVYISNSTGITGTTITGCDISNNCTAATQIAGIWCIDDAAGEIYNNNIHDLTDTASGSSIYVMNIFGYYNTTPFVFSVHDNTVQNISGGYNVSGIGVSYYQGGTGYGTSIKIYNNTVRNMVAGTTNPAGSITALGGESGEFYNNDISNLQAPSAVTGILVQGFDNVYNNIVTGLMSTSASSVIGYNGTDANFYNNMISKLQSKPDSTAATTNACIGAYLQPTNGAGFVNNNSIALDTDDLSGTLSNAFSACIYIQDTTYPITSFRNNILVNTKNSANATGVYTAAPSSWAALESNNCYYLPYGNTGCGFAQKTLAEWQTITGKEANSIVANVPFRAINDLHIDSANASAFVLFHTGTYLSADSTDIDGQTRYNPPCIGADEFYQSAAPVNVTATAATATGKYATLNAAFAAINAGTHQGVINISITGNTTEPSPPTSLVGSGTGAASYSSIYIRPSGGNWTVSSSWADMGTGTAYRGMIELFGAQHVTIDGDDPATPGSQNLSFVVNTTTARSVYAIRLASTNTLGTGGASYDTIRNCIITGPRSADTSTVESGGIAVAGNNNSTDANSQNNYATACNNDAFINNTITRCLYAIWLEGDFNVRRTPFINQGTLILNDTLGSPDPVYSNIAGVYCDNFVSDSDGTGVSGIIIAGNDITGTRVSDTAQGYVFMGIWCEQNAGGEIYNNYIHDFTDSASYGGIFGIYVNYGMLHATMSIHDNNIQNLISATAVNAIWNTSNNIGTYSYYNNTINNIAAPGEVIGIYGQGGDYYNNTISNITSSARIYGINNYPGFGTGKIYNNKITNLVSTGAGSIVCGFYGGGAHFYNNFIGKLMAKPNYRDPLYGGNCFGAYCLSLDSVDNNTIALDTNDVTGSIDSAYSACVYGGGAVFRNNILINTKNSVNAMALCINEHVAASWVAVASNNCYYASHGYLVGNIYANSIPPVFTSLTQWQTISGNDSNSLVANVPFRSLTDLHVDSNNAASDSIFRRGTAVSGITQDIDGQMRNNPPCIGSDEFDAVAPFDSVWPGDANNDRVVDNTDLLPIGLGYDSTGTPRVIQTIVWQADAAVDWADTFSGYLSSLNYNHADCNGDGIIDYHDTTAILQNYGLIHTKSSGYGSPWIGTIPGITVTYSKDTVVAGDTLITSLLLGDSAHTVSDIYGLAFTYNYDALVMDSNSIAFGFTNSWMGNSTNSINIQKDYLTDGLIKAAITGIDHSPRTGYGVIATMRCIITTDNINGKNLSYYNNLSFVSLITAIDEHGNPISLNAGIDSNVVAFYPNGINGISTDHISIWPNPATNYVQVVSSADIDRVAISDMLGQEVNTTKVNGKKTLGIDISSLDAGVYVVQVSTRTGSRTTKLIVSR